MKIFSDKRIISILWAVLRIWLGIQWLQAGWHKLLSPKWVGGEAGVGISGFFKGAIAKATGDHPTVQGWYAGFLENVALPTAPVFSYVITFGELLVGLGLIFGTLTTIALFAGAFMNLNFMLAGTTSTNPILYTLAIILLVIGANVYYYGLDNWFVLAYMKKLCKCDKPKVAA